MSQAENDPSKGKIAKFYSEIGALLEHPERLNSVPGIDVIVDPGHIKNAVRMLLRSKSFRDKIEKFYDGKRNFKAIKVKRKKDLADPQPPFIIFKDFSTEDTGIAFLLKSTRKDLTKRNVKRAMGTFKIRKIALVIIDGNVELWADLIADITNHAYRKMILNGITNQGLFANEPGFAKAIPGTIYDKDIVSASGSITKIQQIELLAPFRPDLYEILYGEARPEWMQKLTADELKVEKVDLIVQLLDAVEIMHCKYHKEHKDLKLENISINHTSQRSRLLIEIADFDTMCDFNVPEQANGTEMSPWHIQLDVGGQTMEDIDGLVRKQCAGKSEEELELFLRANQESYHLYNLMASFGWYVLKQSIAVNAHGKHIIPNGKRNLINGKHDVWTLGLIIYEMIYGPPSDHGQMWRDIQNDQFLKKIFKINPAEIPDITTVKELFKQTSYYAQYLELKPLHQRQAGHTASNTATTTTPGVTAPVANVWMGEIAPILASFSNLPPSQRGKIIDQLSLVLPTGQDLINLRTILPKTFSKDYFADPRIEAYDLTKLLANYWKTPNIDDLEGLFYHLEAIEHVAIEEFRTLESTGDAQWLAYNKLQFFLNAAICLALKKLHKQQDFQQAKTRSLIKVFNCMPVPVIAIDREQRAIEEEVITKSEEKLKELQHVINPSSNTLAHMKNLS